MQICAFLPFRLLPFDARKDCFTSLCDATNVVLDCNHFLLASNNNKATRFLLHFTSLHFHSKLGKTAKKEKIFNYRLTLNDHAVSEKLIYIAE